IGRCAKFGILVKGSTCLDELARAKVAAFDKTGTITEGVFTVTGYTDERVLTLAASAEKASSHPIAAAFENISAQPVTDCKEIAGKGVVCTLDDKQLLCGSAKLLREYGVEFTEEESASTVVYVAHGGMFAGCVFIDDKIKTGAAQAVRGLKEQGVEFTQMLTGDSPARAKAVAAEVGFDGVSASLLPDEKCAEAQRLKERGKLLYVGDGINDAPVMAAADCAVSMGKVGSDAAIEASDIVLVSDSLPLIPKGRKIARGTRSIVMQNIIGSLIIKIAIMALDIAIPGFPLIISVIADVGVMLVAVLNAMRTALLK
ncbi:MAG: HAD-IC family P-type ATPase, partial [Clostridia bacterium]|nr:HAD-IC family P-type ATPase [Clostridia bacterium]